MDITKRTEVLINVHKGLRKALLEHSIRLSSLDWASEAEITAADAELKTVLHFLREHSTNEDEIQFAMLEAKAPAAVEEVQEDHERLEIAIDELEQMWVDVLKFQEKSRAGYEFYLAYNYFLAAYLEHIDREEREFTEAMYAHFTDAELDEAVKTIVARTSPQDMGMMLSYMIPGMNPAERVEMLMKMKATTPPEVFEKVKGLAEKVLKSGDWEKLQSRIR